MHGCENGDRAAYVLEQHAKQAGLDLFQAIRHRCDAVLDREQRHEEQQHLRVPLRLAVLQPAGRVTWQLVANTPR